MSGPVLTKFALLEVLHQGKKEKLCFCAKECAEDFVSFLFAHEKVVGKNLGAYDRVNGSKITLWRTIPRGAQISLRGDSIVSMAKDIQKGSKESGYALGIKEGAIFFCFTMK